MVKMSLHVDFREIHCIHIQAKNVWSTPPQNESKFNQVESYLMPAFVSNQNWSNLLALWYMLQAYAESRNVLLIYSVKVLKGERSCFNQHLWFQESGKFCGVARLSTESRRDGPKVKDGFRNVEVFSAPWNLKNDLFFNLGCSDSVDSTLLQPLLFRFLGFFPLACLPRLLVEFSTLTGFAEGTSASRRFNTSTTLGTRANLLRLEETDRLKRSCVCFILLEINILRRLSLRLLRSFVDSSQR